MSRASCTRKSGDSGNFILLKCFRNRDIFGRFYNNSHTGRLFGNCIRFPTQGNGLGDFYFQHGDFLEFYKISCTGRLFWKIFKIFRLWRAGRSLLWFLPCKIREIKRFLLWFPAHEDLGNREIFIVVSTLGDTGDRKIFIMASRPRRAWRFLMCFSTREILEIFIVISCPGRFG